MRPLRLGRMDARDRLTNLALFAAAGVAWVVVGIIVTTLDPLADRMAGIIGAAAMGIAMGLTTVPLFWLAVFGRHRRLAYRGDWIRAARRGGWVAIVVGLFVLLRVEQIFQLPIALFVVAMVLVAESALSVER